MVRIALLDIRCTTDVSIGTPLLARGRDRLETMSANSAALIDNFYPLLARGRDRLETLIRQNQDSSKRFPYSLGDAIDWKPLRCLGGGLATNFPYSLGDAIDWKLQRGMCIL